jgi:hypothetical protein
MHKVLDVYSQYFLRERIWIRARTQSAPAAILNDRASGIADDRVTTSSRTSKFVVFPAPGAPVITIRDMRTCLRRCLRRLTNSRPIRG